MSLGEQFEKNMEATRNLRAFEAALKKAAQATANNEAEEVSVGYQYEGHFVRAVFRVERTGERFDQHSKKCSCKGCGKS